MASRALTIPKSTELLPIRDRQEWLGWRREVLTGSDVAAVCGVGYSTPLKVWAEKAGRLMPEAQTDIMRRGTWFEPAAVEALKDTEPAWTIRRARVFLRDRERRLGGTPDLVAIDPKRPGFGIVDFKVVALSVFRRDWEHTDPEDDSDAIPVTVPLQHQLQVLTYAELVGASWCAVAPLVISEFKGDFMVLEVPLHPGAWERVTAEAETFWRDFDAGRRPRLRASEDLETIKAMYALPDPELAKVEKPLPADVGLQALLEIKERLELEEKNAKAEVDRIKTILMAEIADASVARLPGWRMTWRLEQRKGYEVAPSSRRVLRIKREG
jgi:predicted phage-related endonuclease